MESEKQGLDNDATAGRAIDGAQVEQTDSKMSTDKSIMSGKPQKTKPKPRARRAKSEVPHAQSLQPAGDDTDPRTTSCSSENISHKTGTKSPTPDSPNGLIRPRSSSRRRAYIIKRPQSAPFFGRVTPRPFSADDPGDSTAAVSKPLPNMDVRKISTPNFISSPPVSTKADIENVPGDLPELLCSKPDNETNTETVIPKSLSLLCKPDKPSSVPPSTSPAFRYGETHLFLRKENSIDRKEHVEISVSETILIHSTKSSSESRYMLSHASKLSSFLGQEEEAVLTESKGNKDKTNVQLYAQVHKPKAAVTTVSHDIDQNEYDDFIQSPAEISTARSDPEFEDVFPSAETSQCSQSLKDNDDNSSTLNSDNNEANPVVKNNTVKQAWKNAIKPEKDFTENKENAFDSGAQESEANITERLNFSPSMTCTEDTENSVVIPRLVLGSLADEDNTSPQDSPTGSLSPEHQEEDFITESFYANFNAIPDSSDGVAFVPGYSEEQTSESESDALKVGDGHCVDPKEPSANISNESIVESPKTPPLILTPQSTSDESSKSRGVLENLKESYALPNKAVINTDRSTRAAFEEKVPPVQSTVQKTQKSKPESASYNPIKKLSVEYTDPVELHSSDILQAGGVAHDPHEAVSSAWSEDTDSEETHKVKKRQHNPLKRLFARKKGKYNPSLDIDASKSILPTLEPEKPKAKKEKSSSPKLFKRKNKAKFFSSESELSPSEENSSKQKKEAKKKQKGTKLTKENIVVIKSSGKSLSDSMPELAILAQARHDDRREIEISTERTRANTDDGKNSSFKGKKDHVNIAKDNQFDQKPIIIEDNNKNHCYANVTLREKGVNDSEMITVDTDGVPIATEVTLKHNEQPEVHTVPNTDFRDNQGENSFTDRSAKEDLSNMTDIINFAKYDGDDNDDDDKAKEETDDVYANTPMLDDPLVATDINIDLEAQGDRPPSQEFSQSVGIQDTILDASDILYMPERNGQDIDNSMLPAVGHSNPDQEPRKQKYLYFENNKLNETEQVEHALSFQESTIDTKSLGLQDDRSKDKQKRTVETRRDVESKRVLASIETTESDNELDEKLLETAAAENPLRRPKYAMTRLQAQLAGKPVPKEPILTESRYADKQEDIDQDQEIPPVVAPKPKLEKKKVHRDRIERGETSLEDASVLDTSEPEFSPRSDISSDATDGDVTSNFDDVIHLCGSVASPPEDQGGEEKPRYKTTSGLNRSPSQLLIRADVHTALDSDDEKSTKVGNKNDDVQHDEEVRNTQYKEETESSEPKEVIDITVGGEESNDKEIESGTESRNVGKDIAFTLSDKNAKDKQDDGNGKEDNVENCSGLRLTVSPLKQMSNTSLQEEKEHEKIDEGLDSTAKKDTNVSYLDGDYARWPGKKLQRAHNSPCQSPTSNSVISKDNKELNPSCLEVVATTSEEIACTSDSSAKNSTLHTTPHLQDKQKSKVNLNSASIEDNDRPAHKKTNAEAHVTEELTTVTLEAEHKIDPMSSISAKIAPVKWGEIDACPSDMLEEVIKNQSNNIESKSLGVDNKIAIAQKDKRGIGAGFCVSKSQTKYGTFPSASNVEIKTDTECFEETIIPSVKPRAECNVFFYTECLHKLEQENTEVIQRPPAIKPKPPSWKMKAFLRKFDKTPSGKLPATNPKPQRHRPGARESINKDLLQDAMKELEEHIDNDFDNESDEGDNQSPKIPSKPTASSGLEQAPSLDSNKLPCSRKDMTEVFEETIVRCEAPKENSIPIERIFMALDGRDHDNNEISGQCNDQNISLNKTKPSCYNVELNQGANTVYNSMDKPEDTVQKMCTNNENTAPEINSSSASVGSSILKSTHLISTPAKIENEMLEDDVSNNFDGCKDSYLSANEPESKFADNFNVHASSQQIPSVPKSVAHVTDTLDDEVEGDTENTKATAEGFASPSRPEAVDELKQNSIEQDLSLDIKLSQPSTVNFDNYKEDQPSAMLSGPPPIPVKKGRELLGAPPSPPSIPSRVDDSDEDKRIIDIGYEDVLDKLSDPEKSIDETPDTKAQTKTANEPTQTSSPSTKRFPFPWRKKSKDVLAKKSKPGQEEKRKNAKEIKNADDKDDPYKTKPLEASGSEDKKKSKSSAADKPSKEKSSKRLRKRNKEKSATRSKSKEDETKNKTKKEKKRSKSKVKQYPVELYHEIEEGSANKEKVPKTKMSPSWQRIVASPSTSASSSPLSSSPLSDDSSDESYYEPVNYVDERELKKEIDEDMKKKLKSADSNGYEIPADGQPLDTRTVHKDQQDQQPSEEYSLPPDAMELMNSENVQSYGPVTNNVADATQHQVNPEPETGEEEPIEPYLTFQYPRYLDDGEIYVGSPVAVKHSPRGTLQTDGSDNPRLQDRVPSSSVQNVKDGKHYERNNNDYLKKAEAMETLHKSKQASGATEHEINAKDAFNDSMDMNYYNDTSLKKTKAMPNVGKKSEMSYEDSKDLMVSSPNERNSLVSPERVSSPELAVKSHISEALSKAFQDFDFGFDGSGPVSDVETSTTSPQADKDRVSSIQWEWKDPPKSGLSALVGSGTNINTELLNAQSSGDSSCQAAEGFTPSVAKEMPLAGVGASVVLGEIKPFIGDSEGRTYDHVNSMGDEGMREADNESLSSDCSSITASPPSSPVSDKPHKERSRFGKALARRQAKSRDKSKGKPGSNNVKRAKSKDKAKRKVSKDREKSKDGKREKSKSRQHGESDNTKNKIKRKESDEKEKWKWPWKRRGSKKDSGPHSANESDKDSEISKEGSKPNQKKNKKKSVASMSENPKPALKDHQQESDKEDVPLNECNPCDEATDLLLETGLRNSSDDHDYFNTFLDSTSGFQLPQSFESYLSAGKETEVQERVSVAESDSPQIFNSDNMDQIERDNIPASLQNYQFDEKPNNHHIVDDENSSGSLDVSEMEHGMKRQGQDNNESPPTAKDIPWSMCQVPAFQSSCSISSDDPWKDYSPLELGKTKSASEHQANGTPDPIKSISGVRKDSASRVDEFKEHEAKIEAEMLSPVHQGLNLSPAVLELNQDGGGARTSSHRFESGGVSGEMSSTNPGNTVAKPKAACRTVSQPIKCPTPPVPRVRKTVRRHRSELATPDESFVVEFSDLWNSSVNTKPEELEVKNDPIPTISSQTSIYNEPAPGSRISSASERSSTMSTTSMDKAQTSTFNSDLELKPKTRRVSATLLDGNMSNSGVSKKIPPKPERKGTNTMNTADKFRRPSQGEEIPDIFPRQKLNSDDGDESGVEYDKLPVRQKKISSKMALKSFIPPVPTKRPVDERVVYTPVNRSPAQRLKSVEKTEYAAPWEESIKALTPTLPPRQYKRSISDTAGVDTKRESRHSFTSIDLGQVDPDEEPHNSWSLRKSVSLDYGLDNEPSHSRFGSVGSGEHKDKLSPNANGKAKRPLFRSFFSLFRRNKKPEVAESIKEPDDNDDDEESVFGDGPFNVNTDQTIKENQPPKTKPEKAKKTEKTPKPEKPPKPTKTTKKQNAESPKKKISVPFLDDRIPEVLNPGLEGRPLCRLLKVNEDETRVVEMIRPQTGPLGIFFTKGQEYNDEGLLVNAFQDPQSCKLFAGILGVGDQVLEIDGCDIRHLSLDQVGDLMHDKERMIVRVMPASVARSAL